MTGLYSLEFLCSDVRKTEKLFVEKLGLTTVGRCGDNVALRRNQIFLALKSAACEEDKEILRRSGTICNNVTFSVPALQVTYEKVCKAGVEIVKHPGPLSDAFGSIQSFIIQSPFPNVTHTIVDTMKYNGVYLPGYEPCTAINKMENFSSEISHIDHIAYACNSGDSERIVKWYEDCLGFTQFRLGEDTDYMTVDYNNGGLKLLAMEYWRCAERGVKSNAVDGIKLVMVESLPNSGKNQVSTFLDNNGGPGVQHVAFHTDDIISTTAQLRKRDLSVIQPPIEYYSSPTASMIDQIGYDKQLLLENGVLFDAEFDDNSDNKKRL